MKDRFNSSAFAASLSQYLEHVFLPSVCPARMEYHEKEATRVKLEILAGRVLPGAKLKPFGSTANGLSLRNSGAFAVLCYSAELMWPHRYGSMLSLTA